MRRVDAMLATAMALSLTGCILRGKQPVAKTVPPPPKPVTTPAPATPPPKLSIPQTNVELPPPQPVNTEALTQIPPPEEPTPTTPATTRPRRTPPPARTQTEPAAPTPATPPATQPTEQERPQIQEIVPAVDQQRYQQETAARKREIQQRLDQANHRHLNRTEKANVDRINGFLKQCEAKEALGDWRAANELAGIGLALARELTGGK